MAFGANGKNKWYSSMKSMRMITLNDQLKLILAFDKWINGIK